MMGQVVVGAPTSAPCEHCADDEYARFVQGLAITQTMKDRLRQFRLDFVAAFPDLREWAAAPLALRLGRLHGEPYKQPLHAPSLHARGYLYYLVYADRLRLDYDYLLSTPHVYSLRIAAAFGTDLGLDDLVRQALAMGYEPSVGPIALTWASKRLSLHTGKRRVDELTSGDVEALRAAIDAYAKRPDLERFYGCDGMAFSRIARGWRYRLWCPQHLLHHRNASVARPASTRGRRRAPPSSPRPDLARTVDRWLRLKRGAWSGSTHGHYALSLRRFVEHISVAAPGLRGFADVTADHMTLYQEHVAKEVGRKTGRPLSISAQRGRVRHVARFLEDGAALGWPGFPLRPVVDLKNLPPLPQRLPRFIPAEQLERVMAEVRRLPCPYQRAAILTARWSGARRGEIRRLAVDCLDAYRDGTPRLRIPAGKTLRERLVPLHPEAAGALREVIDMREAVSEQPMTDDRTGEPVRRLFVKRGLSMSSETLFALPLQAISQRLGLVEGAGTRITAHRFRHTVGTQLAEGGARLQTIMDVLGHESPHMAMIYVRISDEAVLQDYKSILKPGAPLAGPAAAAIKGNALSPRAVHWLTTNFLKTELELGHCLRLPEEGPCECDVYLSCAKFVTTPAYAPRLRARHELELRLCADAQARAWSREVERHSIIARRIEALLTELGEPLTS